MKPPPATRQSPTRLDARQRGAFAGLDHHWWIDNVQNLARQTSLPNQATPTQRPNSEAKVAVARQSPVSDESAATESGAFGGSNQHQRSRGEGTSRQSPTSRRLVARLDKVQVCQPFPYLRSEQTILMPLRTNSERPFLVRPSETWEGLPGIRPGSLTDGAPGDAGC
jgi:hypothetical protein